jgi:hypothetical protein
MLTTQLRLCVEQYLHASISLGDLHRDIFMKGFQIEIGQLRMPDDVVLWLGFCDYCQSPYRFQSHTGIVP